MSEAIDTGGAGAGESGGGTAVSGGTPEAVPTAVESTATPDASGNWYDRYPEDIRSNPSITKYSSEEEFARGHLNAVKAIGGEKIPAPREDWTEADWAEHHTRLGRPANVDDYDLGDFKAPDDDTWDPDMQSALLGVLHKNGANSDTAREVLQTLLGFEQQESEAFRNEVAQETETGLKNLRNEWGKSADTQFKLAERAWREAAGDGFEELANAQLANGVALGNDPRLIKAFASLGARMNEHGLTEGEKLSTDMLSPEAATREKQAFMSEPENRKALITPTHPKHEWAVNRRSELTQMERAGGQ